MADAGDVMERVAGMKGGIGDDRGVLYLFRVGRKADLRVWGVYAG